MKKFLTIFLSALLAGCCLVGCTESGNSGEKDPPEPPAKLEDNSGMTDDKYDLKTYLYPIWKGNTVYNETLWFANENSAPLLYAPDEILSVKSYDLKTTYEQDVDYVIDGGKIWVTGDSKIPYMTPEQYFPKQPTQIALPYRPDENGVQRYWYAVEGSDISKRQVVITYKHSDSKKWTLPRVDTDKLPKTMAKLAANEPLKVVFYGDSITVGANSSNFLNTEPRAESYVDMVKSYLNARYPQGQITCRNTAVGGTDSNWGNNQSAGLSAIDDINKNEGDHFKKRVLDEHPDLLFIAFGMNDQDPTPYIPLVGTDCYQNNIKSMIEKARAQNPNVEIVLISGMIANPDTPFNNKDYGQYQEALEEVCGQYENVALATVLNTVNSLYANGKRFQDCTANNVNHPNDFMMRVYAQTVLYTMFGEDYYKQI